MITRVRRPTNVRRLEIIEAARIPIAERGMQSLAIGNLARAAGARKGEIRALWQVFTRGVSE